MLKRIKNRTLYLVVFFFNIANCLFAFDIKVFNRNDFINNMDITFMQQLVYGDFSMETERNDFIVGKTENKTVIESHFYKEGEYYNCRAKTVLPPEERDDKAYIYINNGDFIGNICLILINQSGDFRKILFDWNDESDLRKKIEEYSEIKMIIDGNVKNYSVPAHIKEIRFEFSSYIKAEGLTIDISNEFPNLDQIKLMYASPENNIIINCPDSVKVNEIKG